jgi:hypothetical protein
MKGKIYLTSILLSTILFISCQSTKIYTAYEEVVYTEEQGEKCILFETKKDFKSKPKTKTFNYIENENLTMERSEEKITVISNTDFKFVAYSFFLKPFVITGAAVVSLGKCLFISTGCFFFALFQPKPFWQGSLFDFEKEKETMKQAKEANKIKYYPEFHKPFTSNHIIVEKRKTKTTFYKTDNEKTVLVSYEKYEYDNTIYVKRELNKDYRSTYYYTNHIGNIITTPIALTFTISGLIIRKFFGGN